MRLWRIGLLACLLAMWSPAMAQDEDAPKEDQGFLKGLMGVLGDAAKESLEETFDEWLGTYKGKLGEVALVERRGNALVLDVTYDGVKRSDGVYVQGEVLRGGETLEGFSNTLTPVTGRRGKVRLTISRSDVDSDWGAEPTEIESSQVQLFLVRETHPDRRFGHIVYDLTKTWTDSDAPDEPAPEAEEAIELAEGETLESSEGTSTQPAGVTVKGPYVKPGTVLVPAQMASEKPSGATKTVSTPAKPMYAAKALPPSAIRSYDFYGKAGSAVWFSGAGKLPFPGKSNDRRGFARVMSRGTLHPDTNAVHMLETRPQWKRGGWIEGRYPVMVLDKGTRFKAMAGFLKGVGASDGVTFRVILRETERSNAAVIVNKKVLPGQVIPLESPDLTPWAGKKLQIALRIEAGKTSAQDLAVWVKPRLE